MTENRQVLKWKRGGPGRQVSACGRYEVEADVFGGFGAGNAHRREWAAVIGGRTSHFVDSMREAKAECENHAAREAAAISMAGG